MKSLAGRTAFLTGAAAGIGRELAVTLFDAGTVLGGLLDDTAPLLRFLTGALGATTLWGGQAFGFRPMQVLVGDEKRGMKIKRNYVGNYCTSLEMAGYSLTLLKFDPELEQLLVAPAENAIRVF